MPNHVTTIIKIQNEFSNIQEYLTNKNGEVDFNNLVLQPTLFDEFNPNSNVLGLAKEILSTDDKSLNDLSSIGNEMNSSVTKCISAFKKTGYLYWRDWRIDNWGTKWNAYKTVINNEDNTIAFDTACDHPFKIIELLSTKFPNILFEVVYADEDLGYNCGFYQIEDGFIINHSYNEHNVEDSKWEEFAFAIKHPTNSYLEYRKEIESDEI